MKQFLVWMSCIVLMQCSTPQKEAVMHIPEGLSIRSQFTTKLDSNQEPVNDVAYITSSMPEVFLYIKFEGLKSGTHQYQYIVHNAQGQHACPQEGVYQFNVENTGSNLWTRLITANCLSSPGEYSIKVYLDGNWVMVKQIKVLSDEEVNSGQYEAYWNDDKHMKVFPATRSGAKGEWIVKNLSNTYYTSITNLHVVTHNETNRIFFIEHVSEDDVYLKELHNYGVDILYTFPTGERSEPRNIRYRVVGDQLYFYNSQVSGEYNLRTGEVKSSALPFEAARDNAFVSPSLEHVLSKDGMLDGRSVVTGDQYCKGPRILWASWNETEDKVYYTIECDEGDAYGFFMFDMKKNQSQRLLDEFLGVNSPVFISNNGTDFIFFIEHEPEQPYTIKVTTQKSYFTELGFGTNFYWDEALYLSYEQIDKGGEYLSVNFLSSPEDYLSYNYSLDMSERSGEIKRVGRVREGALAGKDVYRMIDEGSWFEDKGVEEAYPIKPYSYLIRNENELIMINTPEVSETTIRIPDLDGKKKKSSLFKGVEIVKQYKNQYITGLLSASEMEIPDSPTLLQRVGIVKRFEDRNAYRKLFTHPIEGDIYVKQRDDGSFWRFNGDGTAVVYEFKYDFVVNTNGGVELSMEEYVPYTNRSCLGSPLDFAHIITPDPSRLEAIGQTTTGVSVFGFSSDQDEVLRQEYEMLKESYSNLGEEFGSYKDFVSKVPLFLWRDPFGRYVRFIRREYLAPSNCEPILYLYPESATELEVSLGDKVNVIASAPKLKSGWHMRAEHDGSLIDLSNGRKYDYIFWEGISGLLPPLRKGYVLDTTQLNSFFTEKLTILGLKEKEIADFKEAWLADFKEAPYYFIGFYDQSIIDRYAPMKITPKPETIIRILMDYRPLTSYADVPAPDLNKAPERKGFTVVEWAGLKR